MSSQLANDVARGVYAGDAEYFQKDYDETIAIAKQVGRRTLAAEILSHLDRITSTTAAFHFVRNICKIELGQEPDSLGAEIDH